MRFCALLMVLLVLAPTLLTLTGQHRAVIRIYSPELAEAVEFDAISTHWWEPVTIHRLQLSDLTYSDQTADDVLPVLAINRVHSAQPLWKIVLSGGDGASFVAEQPLLNLAVHDGKTNLESTIDRIAGPASTSGSPAATQLTIVDGTIRMIPDVATASEFSNWTTIENISGTFSTLNTRGGLPELLLVADLQLPFPRHRARHVGQQLAVNLLRLLGLLALFDFGEQFEHLVAAQFQRQLVEQRAEVVVNAAFPVDQRAVGIEGQHLEVG